MYIMYIYIYICMVHAPINPILMFSLLLFVFLGVSAIGVGTTYSNACRYIHECISSKKTQLKMETDGFFWIIQGYNHLCSAWVSNDTADLAVRFERLDKMFSDSELSQKSKSGGEKRCCLLWSRSLTHPLMIHINLLVGEFIESI